MLLKKILLIGSGAREHAIAKAFKKSQHANQLYCYASNYNPGIKELATDFVNDDLKNIAAIVDYAGHKQIDFAIIGPELPLSLGIVDELAKRNIPSIGPTRKLAQIETSKGFTRDLLAKYCPQAIPRYQKFIDSKGVTEFLQKLGDNYVIKADGLMGGKGVKVAGEQLTNHVAALDYCQQLHATGHKFVIEEKLIGQEFSLLSFTDGKNLAHMPIVQDHKRAFANDLGPNTGGMGSYSAANHLLPFLNQEDVKIAEQFNETTVTALHDEFKVPYKGILYGGFMLTKDGVKLIEYNARFGDPEVINLLALLTTDFIDICMAIIDNYLDKVDVQFAKQATVCKYLVPQGYPDEPIKDAPIDVSQVAAKENLYYAAVTGNDNTLYTTSSRTLAVLGIADNVLAAEAIAEKITQQIQGQLFHRKDIGTAELVNQRIQQINNLCGTNYGFM